MKDFIFLFSFAVSALVNFNVLAENLPTQPYLEQQEQQSFNEAAELLSQSSELGPNFAFPVSGVC